MSNRPQKIKRFPRPNSQAREDKIRHSFLHQTGGEGAMSFEKSHNPNCQDGSYGI
jgi:hypothetical protein